MRQHTSANEGTIRYPEEIAFAFNPSPLLINGSSGQYITATMTDGTHTHSERRIVFSTNCQFDLSALARAILSEIEKEEPSVSQTTDTKHTISVVVSVETYISANSTITFSFQSTYVFGLLRHGEEFNPVRHRTYWRNYPFTLGVFAEAGNSVALIIDGSAQSLQTFQDTGIYELPVDTLGVTESLIVQDNIGQISATTFPVVFDLSFSAIDGDEIVDRITLEVCDEECPKALYLRWLDNQGFYCYWLFSWLGDSDVSEVTEDILRNDMNHYAEAVGYQGWYGHREKRASTMTKQAGASMVDADTFAFLRTLLTSPRVDRYIGRDGNDEPLWEQVRVTAQSTPWQRHRDFQDFSFSVILPTYNYQGV